MAEAVAETPSIEDEFDTAFGQAVAAVTGAEPLRDVPPVDKEADAGNKKEGADGVAVPPKDEKAASEGGEKGEAGGEGAPAEPAKDGAASAETPVGDTQPSAQSKAGDDGGGKGHESLSTPGVTAEDIAKLDAKLDRLQPKEPEKVEEKQPEPEPFKYTAEEEKVLAEYEKEWDEHAKVLALRERKLAHDIQQQFVAALDVVLQSINEGLAPVLQNSVSFAKERHLSQVQAAHADWEQHREGVSKWIDSHPPYLRTAMRKTYDEGDTDGTIDLLTRYKKETGVTSEKGAPAAKTAPAKDVAPAEKVAATAPVTGSRTTVQTQGVDPNDYEAAWREAVG